MADWGCFIFVSSMFFAFYLWGFKRGEKYGYSRGRDDGAHETLERIKPHLLEAYPELFKEE